MKGGLLLAMSFALALPVAGSEQDLDALISPGELSRFHAELGGIKNCTSCHAPGQGVADDKCLACHEDLKARVLADRGLHRGKVECASCHNEHQGAAFELVGWDPATFDHAETGYDLAGLHRAVTECHACHKPPNAPVRTKSVSYLLSDHRCIACHTDVHKGQLGEDCSKCHSLEKKFKDVAFNHSMTAFPLVGAHVKVDCESCHRNGKWKGLRFSSCTDCHRDPHQPTLGTDCLRCHNQRSWKNPTFDHSKARFPLEGKHAGVECNQCHRDELPGAKPGDRSFRGLAFDKCTDCHQKDPHLGQFDQDCGRCHDVNGFEQATFDHATSSYPLTGKHVSLACDQCHFKEKDAAFPARRGTAVRYKPIRTVCGSCHVDVHFGQFEQSCEKCHVTDGFHGEHLLFRHDRDSRFQLSGKHVDVLCERCHRFERGPFPTGSGLSIRYKPLSDFCVACHPNVHHESWWRGKTVESLDCEKCHSETSFELHSFDHDRSSFHLDGAHRGLACEACHDFAVSSDGRFLLFHEGPRDCVDCHRSPHLRGMEACLQCHTTSTWRVGD